MADEQEAGRVTETPLQDYLESRGDGRDLWDRPDAREYLRSLRPEEASSRLTDEILYWLMESSGNEDDGVYVDAFDRREGGDRYDEQRAAHVTVAELAGEVIAARAERDLLRTALAAADALANAGETTWLGGMRECDECGATLAAADRWTPAAGEIRHAAGCLLAAYREARAKVPT